MVFQIVVLANLGIKNVIKRCGFIVPRIKVLLLLLLHVPLLCLNAGRRCFNAGRRCFSEPVS
jgi:hypothetical protein